MWLSPVQVVVIPIGEKHHAYANEVGEKLKAAGVRVHVDLRNEKMNAKIREHAMQKVPFQLVVGDKETEAGEVNVRVRGQEKAEGSVKAEAFVERVKGLIESKSRDAVGQRAGIILRFASSRKVTVELSHNSLARARVA